MIRNRHIFAFFFISGFTALIFEVVWAKQACLIFGNTTLASAAVIAAYMTGLALGSHFFGKLADRRPEQGLLLYGVLEGGIGAFALVFPFLVKALDPVYRGIYVSFHDDFLTISLIRFALSFLVLMVPTTLMGGTLPLLSRFLARSGGDVRERVSRLYAMNLFGAMAGTLVSGFVMIAWFGLRATSVIAACMNLVVFAFVLAAVRRGAVAAPEPPPASGEPTPVTDAPAGVRLVLALLFVQGFASFVVQICWTRTTALVLGSSTYSFSAMLATFLAGLGLGSVIVGRLVKRGVRFTPATVGLLEVLAGASVLAFIPAFEWLVYYFVRVYPLVRLSVTLLFATQFVFSAAAMIVPATLLGMVFPAALACLGDSRRIGSIVGRAYAVNTIGCVLGAFTAAFFFIARFGIGGSLRLASALAIAAGIFAMARTLGSFRAALARKVWLVLIVSFLFLFYPWDRNVFSSGVFIYAPSWADLAKEGKARFQKNLGESQSIIFYKDGMSSTVSVLEYSEKREAASGRSLTSKSIRVNGKTDASTIGDMATQLYLGYIPLFAHPKPEDVLVIGLGSGVTLGTVTQIDSVKSVECVEIEPAVVEANRFFSAENNYALKDPRVRVVIGDGRNHIRFSPKRYDVIISEPSNPWISGVSSLFSKENYEEALGRLKDDGIYCQWFHAYQMSTEDFQMIIRTFASVFPEVSLHKVSGSDFFLLGSRRPITFGYDDMMRRIRKNRVIASDLKHFTDHAEHFVLGSFLLSGHDLRPALAAAGDRLNTDDRLALEYEAPKNLHRETSSDIRIWINSIPRTRYFPEYRDRSADEILASEDIWRIFSSNASDALAAGNYEAALMYLKKAAVLSPRNASLYFMTGLAYDGMGNHRRAIRYYSLIRNAPRWQIRAGSGLRRSKLLKRVEETPILRRDVEVRNAIASLSFFMGEAEEAMRHIGQAIDIDPQYTKNYADMAVYLSMLGFRKEGRLMIEKVATYAPEDPAVVNAMQLLEIAPPPASERPLPMEPGENPLTRALQYMTAGEPDKAEQLFEAFLAYGKEDARVLIYLSQAEAAQGKTDEAKAHFERALELGSVEPPVLAPAAAEEAAEDESVELDGGAVVQ